MKRKPQWPTEHKHSIGTRVRYSEIVGDPPAPEVYQIRALHKLGHGEAVYFLEGFAGCVCEDALTVVAEVAQ